MVYRRFIFKKVMSVLKTDIRKFYVGWDYRR